MQDGRAPRIKNRAPAAIQITAEQLLREAQERQDTAFRAPKQRVEDYEELHEYRGRKRKEFEERIRRTRGIIKEWQSYANWEASQGEFARARSVYERALDVDPRAVSLWLSYTETELKSRNVQHARNLFDRAVTLLPRIDQLWYKYVYLEELLQNVPGARQIFERWMQWEPDDKAWQAYIKLEMRYGELDRASSIFERWVAVRPDPKVWVKWAKFEEERSALDKAREVFTLALDFFGDDVEQIIKGQSVFAAFAKMETRLKEFDRARVIYKFVLDRLPRSASASFHAAYTKFEKQHGTRSTAESTVMAKRRLQYEDEIAQDGRNYDAWFDFARLEEEELHNLEEDGASEADVLKAVDRVRDVYERAIAQVPPGQKRNWRRYIFLWIWYAVFEETQTKDYDRCRQIYRTALSVVPHKEFTFAKLWIQFARFEVRRLDLTTARKIMGTSIGMCPKPALFKSYIQLETDLCEFDRARKIYEQYIQADPSSSAAWIGYATLEKQLGDYARARAVFELGISQEMLFHPELLWKAYISFEVEEGEREHARGLYERLVALSGHVKVWLAYAEFEASRIPIARALREEEEEEDEDEDAEEKTVPGNDDLARKVYEQAYQSLKQQKMNDERAAVLTVWKAFEEEHGGEAEVAKVQAMMPLVTKKRRPVADSDVLEEYWDMVFPDDERESNAASFKFLEMAHKWKQTQAAARVSNAPPAPPNEEPTNLNENSKHSVHPKERDEAASSSDEE